MCSYTGSNSCWNCEQEREVEMTLPLRNVIDHLDMVAERYRVIGATQDEVLIDLLNKEIIC